MYKYYIYKITNTINGMSYVGQHKMPQNGEWPRSYFGRGVKLKEALREYGRKNFTKEILEYVEDDEKRKKVSEREKYWIKKENTMQPNGYNILPGGIEGITPEIAKQSAATRKANGYKMPDEVKKKISKNNKNKSKSEIHKQHLSENHHLRSLHKIQHEDGSVEETYTSMAKIAKQYGTNQNTLLRNSAKKNFINGIYLLGIDADKYECCSYKNEKEKRKEKYIDPIVGDICSLATLKNRRRDNKNKYKDIKFKNCIIKGGRNEA